MTKSPVVIHSVLKTRIIKQNKPSFSLKVPKRKTLCQGSQCSATTVHGFYILIRFQGNML